MKLFYTDIFELPLPPSHRFPMSKYRLLRERIVGEINSQDSNGKPGRLDNCELVVPAAASDEQLFLAHSPEYVDAVSRGTLDPKSIKRIGFPWSPGLVERSRRSTGATIGAAQAAMTAGCSVNLAAVLTTLFGMKGKATAFSTIPVLRQGLSNRSTR